MPSTRRLAVTTLGTLQLLHCEDVLDDAVRRETSHFAEDEDGGALEPESLGMGGEVGDGRNHPPLVLAARILDGEYRQRRAKARLEQLPCDHSGGGDAH